MYNFPSCYTCLIHDLNYTCLIHDFQLLKEKYENHPEILSAKVELRRVQDELEQYRNFFDLGERDVLIEEIQDLRSQLQFYIDSSPKPSKKGSSPLQLAYPCESSEPSPLSTIPESNEESAAQRLEKERIQWTEAESKWISLVEELRLDLEASRGMAEKHKQELDLEKKCSEELKEAMQMAMQGHARMLEQYAELEEKHMQLLIRHRKIQDGIEDVKKAAAKAGVRGAESKFINALAAEISALKVEREKERRYYRDENKGLQAQLRDTAEAVQAAGELLVRLKEAEEAITAAEVSFWNQLFPGFALFYQYVFSCHCNTNACFPGCLQSILIMMLLRSLYSSYMSFFPPMIPSSFTSNSNST